MRASVRTDAELLAGAERAVDHGAVGGPPQLRAHERPALARLDVLELDDLEDDPVDVDVVAVLELVGGYRHVLRQSTRRASRTHPTRARGESAYESRRLQRDEETDGVGIRIEARGRDGRDGRPAQRGDRPGRQPAGRTHLPRVRSGRRRLGACSTSGSRARTSIASRQSASGLRWRRLGARRACPRSTSSRFTSTSPGSGTAAVHAGCRSGIGIRRINDDRRNDGRRHPYQACRRDR